MKAGSPAISCHQERVRVASRIPLVTDVVERLIDKVGESFHRLALEFVV